MMDQSTSLFDMDPDEKLVAGTSFIHIHHHVLALHCLHRYPFYTKTLSILMSVGSGWDQDGDIDLDLDTIAAETAQASLSQQHTVCGQI